MLEQERALVGVRGESTPGGPSQTRSAASDAATAAEIIASRASSRRSAVLTADGAYGMVSHRGAATRRRVGADALLEVDVSKHAVEPVAAPLRDANGRGVLGGDPELEALDPALVEAPAG